MEHTRTAPSTNGTAVKATNEPNGYPKGAKVIIETIPTGNGGRIKKKAIVIPTGKKLEKLHGGEVMLEIVKDENGAETHKKVLVIPRGQRPGVWWNGEERPRKERIYDLVKDEGVFLPKFDVRSK